MNHQLQRLRALAQAYRCHSVPDGAHLPVPQRGPQRQDEAGAGLPTGCSDRRAGLQLRPRGTAEPSRPASAAPGTTTQCLSLGFRRVLAPRGVGSSRVARQPSARALPALRTSGSFSAARRTPRGPRRRTRLRLQPLTGSPCGWTSAGLPGIPSAVAALSLVGDPARDRRRWAGVA